MNVEFLLWLDQLGLVYLPDNGRYLAELLHPDCVMDPIREATVDHFRGVATIRDSLRLNFDMSGLYAYERGVEFMKTRFFQTLKTFKGFQKLTLVLKSWPWLQVNEQETAEARFLEVCAELTPHLVPYLVKLTEDVGESPNSIDNVELELQPYKYHMESRQADAARFIRDKDADCLRG